MQEESHITKFYLKKPHDQTKFYLKEIQLNDGSRGLLKEKQNLHGCTYPKNNPVSQRKHNQLSIKENIYKNAKRKQSKQPITTLPKICKPKYTMRYTNKSHHQVKNTANKNKKKNFNTT